MSIIKLSKKTSGKIKKVKTVMLFPHIIICYIIVILAIISIIISLYFNSLCNAFISSLFSNIFAGLITGLIICLISGIKQIYKTKLKSKKVWLQHITEMYQDYSKCFNELLHLKFDCINDNEETYDLVYDTLSRANWINENILQSVYDNTITFDTVKYCKDNFHYDAYELINFFESLHQEIIDLGASNASRKETIQSFSRVNRLSRRLNSAIFTNIREIDARLTEIDKTIV